MDGMMKTAVMLGIGKMGFEEREFRTMKCLLSLNMWESAEATFTIMRRAPSEIMWWSLLLSLAMSRAER